MTAAEKVRQQWPHNPVAAIVLGSGLGPLAEAVADPVTFAYTELPGFPAAGVGGHAGSLVLGHITGRPVAMLKGRAHVYETGDPAAMAAALDTLANLGCETLILTNAAGSLRTDVGPGEVVLIVDHLNLTGLNPLTGDAGDARFVDMSRAYDRDLAELFRDAAPGLAIDLHEGVYMWFPGPSFETPAEIRAARVLGADVVGMSTVPEVILARRRGMRVAALSNITNLAAGLSPEPLSHAQTLARAEAGADKIRRLLIEVVGTLNDDD